MTVETTLHLLTFCNSLAWVNFLFKIWFQEVTLYLILKRSLTQWVAVSSITFTICNNRAHSNKMKQFYLNYVSESMKNIITIAFLVKSIFIISYYYVTGIKKHFENVVITQRHLTLYNLLQLFVQFVLLRLTTCWWTVISKLQSNTRMKYIRNVSFCERKRKC